MQSGVHRLKNAIAALPALPGKRTAPGRARPVSMGFDVKPAPADAVPLDPVQSVPVYDCAVSATCTTSLAAVRYANRNV